MGGGEQCSIWSHAFDVNLEVYAMSQATVIQADFSKRAEEPDLGPESQQAEAALTERLFGATIGALELFSVYLGKQLGLYRALEHAPANPSQLAGRAGIAERYAREWLEQQSVAGLLRVDDVRAAPADRTYSLPRAHVGVLADDCHGCHVAPFSQMVAGVAQALPAVVDAYRTGRGVPYEQYGADFRCGQGGINRPAFTDDLPNRWIPSVPELHQRLVSEPSARIADVGCGEGWSTMALARAYPKATVLGFDLDRASIETARRVAAERGLSARFEVEDAAALARHDPFDLVIVLEALHDMSQPVEALRGFRRALAADGCVIVADEKVADEFTAPGDEIERMMYGWSVSHCLPVAMAEQPSAAIGTVIRRDILERCARDAGFSTVDVLPIENDLFRFYRLRA